MCDERSTKAQQWEIIIFRDRQRLHGPAVDHTGHDVVFLFCFGEAKKLQIVGHVCRRCYSFIFISLPSGVGTLLVRACAHRRTIVYISLNVGFDPHMIMECVASCQQLGLWFSEAKNWPNDEHKKIMVIEIQGWNRIFNNAKFNKTVGSVYYVESIKVAWCNWYSIRVSIWNAPKFESRTTQSNNVSPFLELQCERERDRDWVVVRVWTVKANETNRKNLACDSITCVSACNYLWKLNSSSAFIIMSHTWFTLNAEAGAE